MFDRVMQNLRKQVAALEQEEFFESAIQHRLEQSRDTGPSQGELDEILAGMLKPLITAESSTKPNKKMAGIHTGRPSGLNVVPNIHTGRKSQRALLGYDDGPAGNLR